MSVTQSNCSRPKCMFGQFIAGSKNSEIAMCTSRGPETSFRNEWHGANFSFFGYKLPGTTHPCATMLPEFLSVHTTLPFQCKGHFFKTGLRTNPTSRQSKHKTPCCLLQRQHDTPSQASAERAAVLKTTRLTGQPQLLSVAAQLQNSHLIAHDNHSLLKQLDGDNTFAIPQKWGG